MKDTAATRHRIVQAIEILRLDLRTFKGSSDHWSGKLSTSALSTATAVSALSVCQRVYRENPWDMGEREQADYGPATWARLVEQGSQWLSNAQNADGGFGDTDRSLSNIATTLLVLAAWQLAGHNQRYAPMIAKAWDYVERQGSWDGLRQRYGKDKTFVVPIMTNCALAGIVDWGKIPTLPFEAAALPQAWYRFVQLPVVSYAIPALVAIGQAQHFHRPSSNPLIRSIRSMARKPTLRCLTRMQPTSGGYLEAVPLTSFVLMSLGSIGQAGCRVSAEARKFIVDSVLEDGSWPIDTNLATWVTSLASSEYFEESATIDSTEWDRTIDWLLACQHVKRHPFTGAEPGGWGWTNLSGAVPDADDTPAALLALKKWYDYQQTIRSLEQGTAIEKVRLERVLQAAAMGCRWLNRLQNRDGGWPTFCRGWGTLPFDRSGSDLTAHALRALDQWRNAMTDNQNAVQGPSGIAIDRAMAKGWKYLSKQQSSDGSWLPLWFGNQDRAEEDNPIYGTGRVLLSYSQCGLQKTSAFENGQKYLMASQNSDGGWGGGRTIHYSRETQRDDHVSSTIEETAIALSGIMSGTDTKAPTDSIMRGLEWLCQSIESGHHHLSQPIGFYFARLWYHEQLYPLVFSLSALKKGLEFCQR